MRGVSPKFSSDGTMNILDTLCCITKTKEKNEKKYKGKNKIRYIELKKGEFNPIRVF